MKKIIFLIFLFSKFIIVIAQNNFVESQVYYNTGDTITGFVNNKDWVKSPKEIEFRLTMSSETKKIIATDVKGFFLIDLNQNFESMIIEIENLPRNGIRKKYYNFSKYTNREKIYLNKTVFVKTLTKGKLNLYSFDDFEEHFILKNNDSTIALTYHIFEVDDRIYELKEFQNQLNRVLVSNCQNQNFSNIAYSQKNILKLIIDYNSCFEVQKENKIVKSKSKIEFGISGGMNYSTLNYKEPVNTSGTTYANYIGTNSLLPSIGLFCNFVIPKAKGKFSIQNELFYYAIKSIIIEYRTYNYNYNYVGLQNLFKYKFYEKKVFYYVLGGFSNALIVKDKGTSIYKNGKVEPILRDVPNLKNDEQTLIFGLGFGYKRFMFETKFMKGNGFSAAPSIGTPTKRLDLSIKIKLNKY